MGTFVIKIYTEMWRRLKNNHIWPALQQNPQNKAIFSFYIKWLFFFRARKNWQDPCSDKGRNETT